VQKTGETTRDMWHKADWDKVKEDPKSVQFPREDWIFNHDAEKHAEEVFEESLQRVRGKKRAGSTAADGSDVKKSAVPIEKSSEISVQG
jgi:hypothetical protein